MECQATAPVVHETTTDNQAVDNQANATRKGPQLTAIVTERLSPEELSCLHRLLSDPVPHVDNPLLHESDAEVRLFGVKMELSSADAKVFPAPEPIVGRAAPSASRLPTLSLRDEQRLFLRINYVRMRIEQLRAEFADKPLTLPIARLLVAWGWMELDVRARIVEQNVPLVLAMAKRTRLAGIDYNEMISEGNMALLRSVDKFDCGRGFKFSTYACRAILKSFSRVAIRSSRYRGAFPVEFDPSIEKSDHLERKREGVEADCVSDLKDILTRNMAALTDVEQIVINERFALESNGPGVPMPKTLEQVGKVIGVTKERVRQIQNKALKKIRHALEEAYLAA